MTKKKKQVRLLAAVIAVVFLCLLYAVVHKVNSEDTQEEEVQIEVLNVSAAEVSELTIENTQGTFRFHYDGENWSSLDEPELTLNQDTLAGLMNRLNPLSADRELTEVPEELDAYGLDTPVIAVTLTMQDGSEVQIYMGADSADGNIYLMTSKSDTVYTADSYLETAFDFGLSDLEAEEETEEDTEESTEETVEEESAE
jgi:hypothetical protein